jgi:hypothetical protein
MQSGYEIDKGSEKQTDGHMYLWMDNHTGGRVDRHTDKRMDNHTYRMIDGQSEIQTNSKMDRKKQTNIGVLTKRKID